MFPLRRKRFHLRVFCVRPFRMYARVYLYRREVPFRRLGVRLWVLHFHLLWTP